MRILVAEDEKDLNRLLSTRLKAEHYSVDSCFDGQEALDYLEGANGIRLRWQEHSLYRTANCRLIGMRKTKENNN